MIRNCKICKEEYYTYSSLNTKCYKCVKPKKGLGKQGQKYEAWRKEIALPYVKERDGIFCKDCFMQKGYDLHHTLGRLNGNKYNVDTLVYLCRVCHQARHGIKW